MPIVLRSADLLAVEGDEVIVGCAYKLHIDILSDAKNKKIADDLLSQVNRTSLRLCPRMRASEKDEVVEGVISAFGGKVVS
ncbi:MAG: hypothetical protein ACD_76C00105G0001 [uncultured bacterium]|nr:MAG: hypothetical protein ACD_76C00105G0001 [uncultured bacterium]